MIEVSGGRMRVAGPMVIDSAASLKKTGESAVAAGVAMVDLAAVTEADSAALAILLSWLRVAQERKQALMIVNTPESIRSLAALYGVADMLPLS